MTVWDPTLSVSMERERYLIIEEVSHRWAHNGVAHSTNTSKKSHFTYNLIRIVRIQLILLTKDIFVKVHEILNVKSPVLTVAFSFGGITTTRSHRSHGSLAKGMSLLLTSCVRVSPQTYRVHMCCGIVCVLEKIVLSSVINNAKKRKEQQQEEKERATTRIRSGGKLS